MGFATGKKWPHGVVPYEIESSMPSDARQDVDRALIEWMSKTQLHFVPHTAEPNFIRFQINPGMGGCVSNIGMQGSPQAISCDHPVFKGWEGVAHEIGHAVGLLHEHQRPDRDKWITVPPDESSYAIETGTMIGNYDCVSTMHYPADDPVIKAKAGGCTTRGSTTGLSDGDVAAIAQWYGPGPLLTTPRRAPAIAATHGGVLNLFGRGKNRAFWHKSISGSSETAWKDIGGIFTSQPAAVSFGPDRLAVLGIGQNGAMYHKALTAAGWDKSWQPLGGVFHPALTSPPAAVSWAPNRFDVFGVGMDGGMWHKAFEDGKWYPAGTEWQWLGGKFLSPPAVCSWGPDRLDIFAIGGDRGAWAKSWDGDKWKPSEVEWASLGGKFNSSLAACSWEPGRLDVFGLSTTNSMVHKGRKPAGGWWPTDGWEKLSGTFHSPPAVCSWEPGRLDVFGLGTNDSMFHRARSATGWSPGWEGIGGGVFNSRPSALPYSQGKNCYVVGIGLDGAMYLQGRNAQGWFMDWKPLGGSFI